MRLCRILLTGGIPRQCLAVQQDNFLLVQRNFGEVFPNQTK
jgi:hypothetical protein